MASARDKHIQMGGVPNWLIVQALAAAAALAALPRVCGAVRPMVNGRQFGELAQFELAKSCASALRVAFRLTTGPPRTLSLAASVIHYAIDLLVRAAPLEEVVDLSASNSGSESPERSSTSGQRAGERVA